MKRTLYYFILIFLLMLQFISSAFSSDSGYARIEVEKDWLIIVNDSAVSEITLNGFFLINDSNQRIISLDTNGNVENKDGMVKITYTKQNPSHQNQVYARAIIEVSYPQEISTDAPLPTKPIIEEGITKFTPEMQDQARLLAENSSLATLAAVTEWTYKNVKYDILYLGENLTAEQVFVVRRGICTDYSHLAAALLNSLGFKSRMVSGYVLQNGSFQPHAWLEVFIGNDTGNSSTIVSIDPTFGEAGALSANRISMVYTDGIPYVDTVNVSYSSSKSVQNPQGVTLSVNFSAVQLAEQKFPELAALIKTYNNKSGELKITIANPSYQHILLTYNFFSPPSTYGKDMHILALKPGESITFAYPLNLSDIQNGYIYTIPFLASVQGTDLNDKVEYSLGSKFPTLPNTTPPKQPQTTSQQQCPLGLLFLLLVVLAAFASRMKD